MTCNIDGWGWPAWVFTMISGAIFDTHREKVLRNWLPQCPCYRSSSAHWHMLEGSGSRYKRRVQGVVCGWKDCGWRSCVSGLQRAWRLISNWVERPFSSSIWRSSSTSWKNGEYGYPSKETHGRGCERSTLVALNHGVFVVMWRHQICNTCCELWLSNKEQHQPVSSTIGAYPDGYINLQNYA